MATALHLRFTVHELDFRSHNRTISTAGAFAQNGPFPKVISFTAFPALKLSMVKIHPQMAYVNKVAQTVDMT